MTSVQPVSFSVTSSWVRVQVGTAVVFTARVTVTCSVGISTFIAFRTSPGASVV